MVFQVDITVESFLRLRDRASQLRQAARQAQLEKERILNLSAEALDKLVEAQAAKGLSVDGQPLYSPATKQPQIDRRPAAKRPESVRVAHGWTGYETVQDFGYSPPGIRYGNGYTFWDESGVFSLGSSKEISVISGNGSNKSTAWTTGSQLPELPIEGYEWEYTYDYYWNGFRWTEQVYGMRKARHYTSNSSVSFDVILPAGKNKTVHIVYKARCAVTVDAISMHSSSSFTGYTNYLTPPLGGPAPIFSQYLEPGATIPFGPYYTSTNTEFNPVVTAVDTPQELIVSEAIEAPSAKVFVCDNAQIKEISPSGALQDFVDYFMPVIYNEDATISGIGGVVSIKKLDSYPLEQTYSWRRNAYAFTDIQAVYPFTDPSKLKDELPYQVLPDPGKGGYAVTYDAKTLFVNGLPLSYLSYKNESTKSLNSAILNFSANRVPAPDLMSLAVAWDGNDSTYCVNRLIDLGFTLEDLALEDLDL